MARVTLQECLCACQDLSERKTLSTNRTIFLGAVQIIDMFPIRDTIPAKNPPIATWFLILANAFVFLFELTLSPQQLEALFYLFGIVPARFSHPAWAQWVGFPNGPVDPQLGQYPD